MLDLQFKYGKAKPVNITVGTKPDFSKVRQPYRAPNDPRDKKFIANGIKLAKLYDWWYVNQVKNVCREKTKLPCQVLEKAIAWIIRTPAIHGDLIIDPFGGGGTILKIAKDLG